VSDVLRQHQRLTAALCTTVGRVSGLKEFSSRPGAVLSVAGGAAALHLTAAAARARARADTRLNRAAGAAAAAPEDASHEIVAMRIDASASQRWSARRLVMPRGGGDRDLRASAFNMFIQFQIRSSSASVVGCGMHEVRGQLLRHRRRCT
jgi:hypothetical protein